MLWLALVLGLGLPAWPEIARPYLRTHMQQVRVCYEDGLLRDPTLTARLELELVFDDAGALRELAVTGAPSLALEGCIANAARAWALPGWHALLRQCDAFPGDECKHTDRPDPQRRLRVRYPIRLQPVDDVATQQRQRESERRLHEAARACWQDALMLGFSGDERVHLSRDAESDGFQVLSVEETRLPAAPAICLAQVAARHLSAQGEAWLWLHVYGDE